MLAQREIFTPATAEYQVRVWTVEAGYPHVAPTCFAQTPDGYLWIGSYSNLTRFDGMRFEVIAPPEVPALKDGMVLQMIVAHDGALWVAGNRGVGRLQRGNWRCIGVPVRRDSGRRKPKAGVDRRHVARLSFARLILG